MKEYKLKSCAEVQILTNSVENCGKNDNVVPLNLKTKSNALLIVLDVLIHYMATLCNLFYLPAVQNYPHAHRPFLL